MKKLFLILAAIPALCLASCSKDDPQDNGGRPDDGGNTPGRVTLTDAVYYGEKLGGGVGFYSIFLENGNESLRLDMFGTVANDPSSASLGAGEYTLGSIDSPANRTYFAADSVSDDLGTLYWNGDTAYLVSGGTVTVNVAAGGYRLTIKLNVGDKEINWVYNGKIAFINQYERAPRVPVEAHYLEMAYLGTAPTNDNLGYVGIILLDDPYNFDTSIQLMVTIPIPEDSDKLEVPTGTFTVSNSLDAPYQIEAGYLEGIYLGGSYEWTRTAAGYLKSAVMIEGGTMTIEKNGEQNYTIKTNLSGSVVAPSGQTVAIIGYESDIIYELNNYDTPSQYIDDQSLPYSTITNDIDISELNLTDMYYDAFSFGSNQVVCRMVFTSPTLSIVPAQDYSGSGNVNLNFSELADAALISVQLTIGSASSMPTGRFPMYNEYDYDFKANVMRPAMPGEGEPLALLSGGSWFVSYYSDVWDYDGETYMFMGEYAGFCKNEGYVTITVTGDENNMTASLTLEDVVDKHGYTISGTASDIKINEINATRATAGSAAEVFSSLPKGTFRVPVSF